MSYIYRVTAKTNNGKLVRGMSVEIVISNNSRQPSQNEIMNAFNQRYGADTVRSGIGGSSYFDITRLS